jgi:hypothetical protein
MDGLKNISGWIIVTTLAMVLGIGAAECVKCVQQAGNYNDETDFEFRIAVDGESVMITGYVGEGLDIRIPPKLQGLPVTEIGERAFYEMGITGIIIPNSVIEIKIEAFSGNQLTSVVIPNSVTEISHGVFSRNQLTSIAIPSNVTTIRWAAFAHNQLTSITIPNGVTRIDQYAFADNQLANVVIPNSVTAIEPMAFYDNPLTEFSVAVDNTAFVTKNSFLLSKDEKLLILYYGSTKAVTVPSSVAEIGRGAFANRQLTSVVIPSSVTAIDVSAFIKNQLVSITIGANVNIIGKCYETFDGSFDNVYNSAGQTAGTYILRDGVWSRQ